MPTTATGWRSCWTTAFLAHPTIHSKISDNGVIEGLSGQEEAADLALNLRAGSLPASVEFLEQREVGASLGADSIREGLISGIGRRGRGGRADAGLLQGAAASTRCWR